MFNYKLMKLKESGVISFILKSYENKYGGISRNCGTLKRQKGTSIDFHTIIAAALVFLVGLLLSILILFGEILLGLVKNRHIDVTVLKMSLEDDDRELSSSSLESTSKTFPN